MQKNSLLPITLLFQILITILFNTMNLHRDRIGRKKRFQCSICEYSSDVKLLLERHLKSHTCTETFSCDICSEVFTRQLDLFIHMRMHNDQILYSCAVCKASFAERATLDQHEKLHTESEEQELYTCSVCDKSFTKKSHLNMHEKSHNMEKPGSNITNTSHSAPEIPTISTFSEGPVGQIL